MLFFRFIAGLDCLGLVAEMQKCPVGYAGLFLFHESPLSANVLLDNIFSEYDDLAESGSNSRSAQNETISYWRDYVVEVAGNLILSVNIRQPQTYSVGTSI